MTIMTPLHGDHQLDQLAAQFVHWRQTRTHPNERIPGIVKLTQKIARLCSKERTKEGFGLSRAPVFSLFPPPQLSSRGGRLGAIFIHSVGRSCTSVHCKDAMRSASYEGRRSIPYLRDKLHPLQRCLAAV